MRQNFLVWLFDERAFGVMEIDKHTKALLGEAEARKKSGKIAREWIPVLYKDEENSSHHKLTSAVAGDNIYILGHTNVGLTSLWSKSSGGAQLTAEDIARRLEWIDLPDIAAKLKLFSCYSAVSGLLGTSNLAKSVKEHLKYKNIEVYGYTETVTDYQEVTYYNPVPHKWTSSSRLASRASACRIKV